MASFGIVATSGQIQTISGVSYDHEAKDSYTVTVTASDGTDSAVATVTISVTDVDEPPDAPSAILVTAVTDSSTSLTVSWTAPANDGKPAIESYDVQYRVSGATAWTDGPEDVTTTTTTVSGLTADTEYEVQVRATNDEGDSDWSDPPGSGQTNMSTNIAPTAADKTVTTVQNTNYTFSRTDFGFVDADDDQLASVLIVTVPTAGRLVLDGDTVMASQTVTRSEIVVGSGLKFEPADGASGTGYASFDFKVNDGTDDSVIAYTMTINVTIITAPDAPTGLTATASGQAWIELAWTAPVRAGGRAITGYRIEVSPDGSSWSDLVLVAATRSTATTYVHKGLSRGATRHYRVSAINVAGTSDPSGSDHATTRTDEQLVSNFNHRGDVDNEHLAIQNVVGIFTTGSRDARLNSIELKLGKFTRTSDTPVLKLYEVESVARAEATAGNLVATLITPTTSLPRHSVRTFNYRAPSGISLTAGGKYIFVLEELSAGIVLVETTNDTSEDAVKADGWTIDGSGTGASPHYINAVRQIVVRVNGTLTPNSAPTAAHNTVTMAEDGRYEFSATDFGFHDTNLADALVSVRIVTVPAAGVLALDGTDVTLNQVVTKTRIDDGDLTFTPATGGSGDNYASFTFKVNDGTVDSAGAYTMRIDVTPTPPLTGQIFVDNTAETEFGSTLANNQSSQSFTTGPNSGGYILTSIGVVASLGDNFSVAVHNADADGAPDALHTSLIPPGNFREGEKHTIHFRAPPNTRLRPNTTYSIVLGPGSTLSGFPRRHVIATQSDADNANGSGWSIGDALHIYRNSVWSSPFDGRSVKIVIRGNTASGVANNAPVFSPATLDRSIAENTAAGRNVGAVVTATDADNDPLGYTLGGADMASFDFDETTGQIRTKAGVSYDHEAQPSYTVTVTASDGTATAVADVTISVTDVAEPPRAPATPVVSAVAGSNTSLTVAWAAPANAGRPAIDSYDLQYRASGATDWIDGPDHSTTTTTTGAGLVAYTLHAARVTGLTADTLYEARVRAVNDEGNSGWSTPPGAGRTNTLTNNAPVFSPAIVDRSIVENIVAGEDIGAPVTATDADAGDTLTYTLGGADMASFDIVETTGQIRTKVDVSYDFEARSSYTVTVTASDGAAGAAAIVTISVTDVAEPPDAPAMPEVSAVFASATSLSVSWDAPANDGRPAIDSYDVQYRVGSSGPWTDVPQDVTGTTATITGLTAATDYQVRVRAVNAEGDSGWSDPPGAGRTHPLTHIAPMFSSLIQTREIEENTGADVNVGAAVTATDVNNDTLNYTLGGADMASFDIVETTGQIRTKSGVSYDFETKDSYAVTVTASDGALTTVAEVTINVIDVPELPDTPATPTVSAVSGSTPSLSVSWIAPPNEGRPPIDHYHVQWHVSGATAWNGRDVDAPATTTIISDLTADTEYEVRVRADNAERDSGFSDPPWVGRTNTLTNNAPVFSSSNVALGIAENTAAGVNVGDPVTATDADAGDTLSYTLRGADAEFFDIVDTTGQILTKDNVSYDFEAKPSYTVTVRVSDSAATAEASVTISITDEDEPPVAPATPTVSAVADSNTRLSVSWTAPANAGKPAIASYDVQYRISGATAWTDGPQNVTTTTTTVSGLTADTLYEVQVRATNDEGDSGWSDPPGSGRTNTATTNNAPVFSSSNVSRELVENTAAGQDVGAAVTATDTDAGDTLAYTLGGTDAASFDIVGATGQIRTISGVSYDHEAKDSHTVTVTASDGTDTAVADVTITITDVAEPPDAPSAISVTAVTDSSTSLTVSWTAPANDGKPDIESYDVRYRVSGATDWTDGPEDVTGTTTPVSGLTADTLYEVQVRATNDEGDSDWSDLPGEGRTNTATTNNAAEGAPTITGTAQVGETLTAATTGITDADGLTSATYAYQWIRANGTEVDIAGANSSTYTLDAADLGKTIKVKVSFTDDGGTPETLTSAATATVTAAIITPVSAGLVSNLNQLATDNKLYFGSGSTKYSFAQGFTTGASTGGYTLTSIDVAFSAGVSAAAIGAVTASVWTADSSGNPDAEMYTLNKPASFDRPTTTTSGGNNEFHTLSGNYSVFTAPANTTLNASTQYLVVVSGGPDYLFSTASDAEIGAAGWLIANAARRKQTTAGSWAAQSDGHAMSIRVNGTTGGGTPTNNAPVFSSSSVALDLAENTAADQDVGAAVTATDADGDTLAYTLGGIDADSFGIGETTGQIRTISGGSYDHEAKDSYTVTVTASDGTDSAVADVTITITDVDEPPDAPATPTVTAAAGSSTSLTVSWDAPANAGKPDIDSYDVQYRESGDTAWIDGPQNVTTTTTTATITGLTAATEYEAQVRATNDEGVSGWSDPPGEGRTNLSTNNAAEGAPTITGTAQVGETLTAATTGITDADGLTNATYTYQWIRVDGTEADITDADSSTYILVDADAGKTIKVRVSFTDDAGNSETLTSVATATVDVMSASGELESLVSNFEQTVDGEAQIIPPRDIVGVFTTGARGAELHSIEFRLFSRLPDIAQLPSATLYRASVTDTRVATRGEPVAALTAAPGSPRPAATAQTVEFNVPDDTPRPRLDADTTYLVVLEDTGYVSVESTTYPAEDAGGAPGWAVDGIGTGNSSPWSYGTTASLLMRVTGTPAGATVATAPEAPASLGATAGDAQVTLSWTPPGSDGGAPISKYQYRYSAGSRVDPETAWTDVPDGSDTDTSLADERSVTVTELDNGRQYAFEVRAVNSVRAGAAATATATPAAAPRTGFLVSNFGQPVDGAAQIIPLRDIVGVFTTGEEGATLGSIEFRLFSTIPGAAPLPSATLYHGSVTDTRATRGERVATLTAAPESPESPESPELTEPPELTDTAQTIAFTAPDGGTSLEAGATYLVVLSESAYVRVESTDSLAQDAGGASGWTIDGVGAGNSSPWSYGTSDSLLMSVNTAAQETTSQQLEAPVVEGAAISVADASVTEGADAVLAFEVTLDRASSAPVTVDYATGNGTATAGEDYVAQSGDLTFAAGETAKTVEVEVLDDLHDEGTETMTLTLSNPSGARIADATATGSIENTDHMPKAWMVRFGRTVGSQVVDALGQRLAGGQASHVTVAGIPLTGGAAQVPDDVVDDALGLPEWAKRARREEEARTITADDLRLRSTFHLSSGSGEPGEPAFTTWGRVSTGGFSAQDVTTT